MRSHICWINLRLERLGWRASFVCFRPLNIAALRSNGYSFPKSGASPFKRKILPNVGGHRLSSVFRGLS